MSRHSGNSRAWWCRQVRGYLLRPLTPALPRPSYRVRPGRSGKVGGADAAEDARAPQNIDLGHRNTAPGTSVGDAPRPPDLAWDKPRSVSGPARCGDKMPPPNA